MIFSQRGDLAYIEKIFDFSMEVRGVNPSTPKAKHCNQGKTFLILISCLSLVDTRFVLLFLEFTKRY